jgi:hypothetical protein
VQTAPSLKRYESVPLQRVIHKLSVRWQWDSVVGDALAQGRQLTVDGLSISLFLAGDAGVNGGFNMLHASY